MDVALESIRPENRIKRFVRKHKVAITVAVTSTIWTGITLAAQRSHNEFLKEKGLYDEYYTPRDEDM